MKIKFQKRIKSTGRYAPTGESYASKRVKQAHKQTDTAERRTFGKKKFQATERLAKKIPAGELLGKVTRSGNIIISKRVPKKLVKNVIFHEKYEKRLLRRKR